MDIQKIEELAENLAQKFNPSGLSPFPFEELKKEYLDLVISQSNNLPDNVSGAISMIKKTGNTNEFIYTILINSKKVENRKYFTIAHELGHYFLHKKEIKSEEVLVDQENSFDNINTLFRLDNSVYNRLETEANRFAASLIMPRELILKAWKELKNVEECAKIFNVSVSAMSIRLEKLNLLE